VLHVAAVSYSRDETGGPSQDRNITPRLANYSAKLESAASIVKLLKLFNSEKLFLYLKKERYTQECVFIKHLET